MIYPKRSIVERVVPFPSINVRGEIVALGPVERSILPHYHRWFNDNEMLKLIDRRFRPRTRDWVEHWFERHNRAAEDHMVFTIWTIDGWIPVGNCALQDIDVRNRSAEFGIFIGDPRYRGRGIGREASCLLIAFAFRTLGLENLMLRVHEYNDRAIALYKQLGFREVGRRRRAQFMDGRFWDVIYMDCLPADFTDDQVPPK